MSIPIRTEGEIDAIARAGRVVWNVLDELIGACVPGVTTQQIDDLALRLLQSRGAEALTRSFAGEGAGVFPGVCCVNINDAVAHSVPSAQAIRDGDVVSLDLCASRGGWCADACRSFMVGQGDEVAAKLCEGARVCLEAGVRACLAGRWWSEAAAEIRETAQTLGLRIVPGLGGHGIGRSLHESPLAWLDPPGVDFRLHPGLVLTIEPPVTLGGGETETPDDAWTIRTRDGARAACEERTIAITPDGPRILTGPAIWDGGGA